MTQFLRIADRQSKALRHATRILCIGGPVHDVPAGTLLDGYFGQNLTRVDRLTDSAATAEFDAVFVAADSAEAAGVTSLAHLDKLARGRQVVCSLGVLADLAGESLLVRHDGPVGGDATVVDPGWFGRAFGPGDVLPWRGSSALRRGANFGSDADDQFLQTVLQTHAGLILAIERKLDGGRILAIDWSGLNDNAGDGYRDFLGTIILEALGAEAWDLAQYRAPWLDYETHIRLVETWAAMQGDLITTELLTPATPTGRQLRKLSIAERPGKPVVLISCCTHGHEWGPAYGVFHYLQYLVDDYRRGGAWGRAVLDNLSIIWVPVVSVDGFHETWRRGVLVPHGPNWVDLNRDYPPNWDRQLDRPKGPHPLSQAETQILESLMREYLDRGLLFSDCHECGRGFYPHSPQNPWLKAVGADIEAAFDRRYLHEDLGMYHRDEALEWVEYAGTQALSNGPTAAHHAAELGWPQAMVSEFFGNDDFTPFQILARIDAAGTVMDHMIGGLLGRTGFNHRVSPRTVELSPPDRPADEPQTLLTIDADGAVVERSACKAGDAPSVTLQAGQRALTIGPEFQPPSS